jgi:hypothetical protein
MMIRSSTITRACYIFDDGRRQGALFYYELSNHGRLRYQMRDHEHKIAILIYRYNRPFYFLV